MCFTGSGGQYSGTHHCKIVKLMLCLIPVEKTSAGVSVKQDTEKQGTKEPVKGIG